MKKIYLLFLAASLLVVAGCGSNNSKSEGVSANTENEQKTNSTLSDNGLVTVKSANSVEVTYQKLVDAIKSNEAISIIAELNHKENAASVGMQLPPTRVLMFGNPQLGTPLMQSSQTTGIDLPQKFLVYENADGQVFIAYNDPGYLANRHDIDGNEEQLSTISNALQNLAESAAE